MSIWDKKEKTKIQKELTDEIKHFWEKKKAFDATNETNTYAVIVFSCEEDKNVFLQSLHLKKGETFIDGYALAKQLNIEPKKPSVKLPKPLNIK